MEPRCSQEAASLRVAERERPTDQRPPGDPLGAAMQAVAFAMETQARLLEAHWPAAVLKMPQCREVNSKEQEEPLFRGPRVRMGIHWASEGTVAQR